jgi:hypothetical protein
LLFSEALPFTAVHLPQNVRLSSDSVRLTAARLAGNWRDVRDSDHIGNAERVKTMKGGSQQLFFGMISNGKNFLKIMA